MKPFCKIAFLALALVCGMANMQAQNVGEWKDKPVTLRVSNQPLGKVLEMVARAVDAKITLQDGTSINRRVLS